MEKLSHCEISCLNNKYRWTYEDYCEDLDYLQGKVYDIFQRAKQRYEQLTTRFSRSDAANMNEEKTKRAMNTFIADTKAQFAKESEDALQRFMQHQKANDDAYESYTTECRLLLKRIDVDAINSQMDKIINDFDQKMRQDHSLRDAKSPQ